MWLRVVAAESKCMQIIYANDQVLMQDSQSEERATHRCQFRRCLDQGAELIMQICAGHEREKKEKILTSYTINNAGLINNIIGIHTVTYCQPPFTRTNNACSSCRYANVPG